MNIYHKIVRVMTKAKNIMAIAMDEGKFLNQLLSLTNAKDTMEIGIYTRRSIPSIVNYICPSSPKVAALHLKAPSPNHFVTHDKCHLKMHV